MSPVYHEFVISPGFRRDFFKKYRERQKHKVWSSRGFYYLNFCGVKAQDYMASDVLKI